MTLGLVHMTYFEYLERNLEVAKVQVQQFFYQYTVHSAKTVVKECESVCVLSVWTRACERSSTPS